MTDRELGPEMKSEGWRVRGGEWIYWVHAPSNQSVDVDAYPRCNVDSPAFPDEPPDPNTPGYLVSCRQHDELGNPVSGDGVWVESYALAIKTAREIRARILSEQEQKRWKSSPQLTLDDVSRVKP